MRKLDKYPRYNAYAARLGNLRISTERDGCSYVTDGTKRGPKKHSRKAALLAFWHRGFIAWAK